MKKQKHGSSNKSKVSAVQAQNQEEKILLEAQNSSAGIAPGSAIPEDDRRQNEVQSKPSVLNCEAKSPVLLASSLGDFLEDKIFNTEVDLLIAGAENQLLKDQNEALERLVDQATYLGSLLSDADLHRSFMPSARIGRHPAETMAIAFMETGWRGKVVPKEWLMVWRLLHPTVIIKMNIEFKERLDKYISAWGIASPGDRPILEKAIKGGLEARTMAGRALAFTSPRNLLEFYRTTLPPTAASSRRQMTQIVSQLGVTEQQRAELKLIWAKHSDDMTRAADRVEVAKLALAYALQAFHKRGVENMSAQAEEQAFLATHTRNLNNALLNSTLVYFHLFEAVSRVATWRQRTALSLGMRPYTANNALFCEIVCEMN